MIQKISVCGKGGCGKSVVVSLMSRALSEEGYSVLTIDSDESNPGLYRMLGLDHPGKALVEEFPGGAHIMREFELEKISISDIPSDYLTEEDNIRLMVAGKINFAFQGCACALGSIVKHLLGKINLREKEVVIVDTEAGVEHFGRGLEKNVDLVLVVVEPYFESFAVAKKIDSLAKDIGDCEVLAVMNKTSTEEEQHNIRERLHSANIKIIGSIRYDSEVSRACLYGEALGHCQAKEEVRQIIRSLLGSGGR